MSYSNKATFRILTKDKLILLEHGKELEFAHLSEFIRAVLLNSKIMAYAKEVLKDDRRTTIKISKRKN